jgi:hypothetical protein
MARSANAIADDLERYAKRRFEYSKPGDDALMREAAAVLRQEPADNPEGGDANEATMPARTRGSVQQLRGHDVGEAREGVAPQPSQPAADSDAHQMAERLRKRAALPACPEQDPDSNTMRDAADFILAQARRIAELDATVRRVRYNMRGYTRGDQLVPACDIFNALDTDCAEDWERWMKEKP